MMRELESHHAYLSREIFGELQLGASQIIEYPGTGHAETLLMGQWKSSVSPVAVNALARLSPRYRSLTNSWIRGMIGF